MQPRGRTHFALLAAVAVATAIAPTVAEGAPTGGGAAHDLDRLAVGAMSPHALWVMVCSFAAALMLPGLALFYGGMVRGKNVLGTMMHTLVTVAVLGTVWWAGGYALAFGHSLGGVIGWSDGLVCLSAVTPESTFAGTSVPTLGHFFFTGLYAMLAAALLSGAVAERSRFGPYCLFIAVWTAVVFCPLCHALSARTAGVNGPWAWVGWLRAGAWSVQDAAGGLYIHVAAGFSALALVLTLRRRVGYPERPIHPNSIALTLLGAGLLWVGWMGAVGGSLMVFDRRAVAAVVHANLAAAAGGMVWMLAEWIHHGKPSALGMASGLVAGLVAITSAAPWVSPPLAYCLGGLGSVVGYLCVWLKPRMGYDDSLDAFALHGACGLVGGVAAGFVASSESGPAAWFVGQLLGCLFVAGYSFGISWLLIRSLDAVWRFTCDPKAEIDGLDLSEHGQVGFDLGPELKLAADQAAAVPRSAASPPSGRHFTILIDGPASEDLTRVWSSLCQAGPEPPAPELVQVYSYVTTVENNRFRFRGGDSEQLCECLERLLRDRLRTTTVRARVEDDTD